MFLLLAFLPFNGKKILMLCDPLAPSISLSSAAANFFFFFDFVVGVKLKDYEPKPVKALTFFFSSST